MSCAFATSMATPDHVVIAESLGYERAWCYDSPALYPDVWVQLCRAADRTSRIGLGPGVLIPSLRHPMVTAAAIATLVDLAGPERVVIGVGTGFTGRYAMGQRGLKWADLVEYVRQVKALLRGEVVMYDGGNLQMLHPDGFGAPRPINVPFVFGASGPKGLAAVREAADGAFIPGGMSTPGIDWQTVLFFGTVLEPDESADSPRVFDAAGHAAAVNYHASAEYGILRGALPGMGEWEHAYDDVAPELRHLAMHDRHLIAVNDRDRPYITGELIAATGNAYSPAQLRDRLALLEDIGATEVAYQPAGDIPRELEVFAKAVRG